MDMNHQFLHRRLMGRIQGRLLAHRSSAESVEADYTFTRDAGRRSLGERFMIERRRAPASGHAHNLMTIATAYPYQTLRYWPASTTEPALDLWNVYVPIDAEQRHNRTFGLMMIRRPGIPGLIHLLWPFIVRFTDGIFAEDRWIVEQEQCAFDRQGRDENQEISPVILALRALLVNSGIETTQNASREA